MTGADRQWQLNRANFAGRWCGSSHWYLRDPAAGASGLDLHHPSRVIDDTCYAISFSDADNGVWDGSGLLLAPGGRRRLNLTRQNYNSSGMCWQFAGAGGQSSLALEPEQGRWGHEINLFHGRSRSMLVLLWGQHSRDGGSVWLLDSVGAVAFRCHLSEPIDPPRPSVHDAATLLEQQRGWPGLIETLAPGQWPADAPTPRPCEPFDPESFARPGDPVAFCDGLVCAVPEQLPQEAFTLHVGCRLTPDRFDQISLVMAAEGQLIRWERRRFSRDG